MEEKRREDREKTRRDEKKEKRRDTTKKKREDERENYFPKKCFKTLKPAR